MSKRTIVASLSARAVPLVAFALAASVFGCSGDEGAPLHGTNPPSGGTSSTGGTSSGGSAAGTTSSAGAAPSGTGTGGNSGGSTNATGGTSTAGGSAAGTTGSGGSSGSGGHAGGSAGGATGGTGGTGGGGASCATFKLCDDFETDAPGKGASVWKASGNGIEVVTDQHHGGSKAVHISAPNTQGFSAMLSETKTFPATDFWGRAFLRFKGDGGGHQMYIAVNLQGDQLRLLNRLGSDNAQVNFQKSDIFYNTNTKVPMETWFCYEWHVTTSAVNIWIDGKAQTTKSPIPGITGGTSLQLGYQRYATGSGAGDIWIDDVAVNDTQIGCQ